MSATETVAATNGKADAAVAEIQDAQIQLRPLERQTYLIPIVGVTPAIPHKWSEKALRMMREKQSGSRARPVHEPKDPEAEAEAATYRLPDGRAGIPATAFKAAMVSAVRSFGGITMVQAKTLLFVQGEGRDQLVAIEGPSEIVESTPRNQTGVVDLRYRRFFWPWTAELEVTFKPALIDLESVIALVQEGGDCGVGDWRPSAPKSMTGTYGRFTIPDEADIRQINASRSRLS